MDALRNLEILITSRTPLIAIENLNGARAEEVLALRQWVRGRAAPAS